MRPSKNQIQSLEEAINYLENQKNKEFDELKVQLFKTSEHFRPINILSQTIKVLGESPVLKTNLFETLISVTGGYFSKKLILGKSNSFSKKILGYVIQYSATNFISKNVSSKVNE